MTAGRPSSWGGCLALLLFVVIAIRFAEPIVDGDLFWQMAYARQMLAGGTLIPDHGVYSWTPASNAAIYCAWASELLFLWLWDHLGMASLFALRYLCVLAVMALMWSYSRRLHFAPTPFFWLVLIIALLGSAGGSILKPEMLSMVLFNAMIWLYFQWKTDGRARWLYLLPVLLLVWVNTHGAFVLAAPFFASTFAGELVNRRISRDLVIAWALCGLALFATPYGWRYPWMLLISLRQPRPDIAWNDAHQTIFSGAAAGTHFPELFGLMALILALLAVRAWRLDCSILLLNLAYAGLFLLYLRTTFFWPPVFGYSALYLASLGERGPAIRLIPGRFAIRRVAPYLCTAVFLFLGAQASLAAWSNPLFGSWLGFGIGYANPVPEAEFLASARLGPNIYNIFDSGGYLLWRLYPQYKVMTDSRSFPYLSWFEEQYQFSLGVSFEDFIKRYPADTAVINLMNKGAWRNFLASPDWQPVFYGPTAAVFVKKSLAFEGKLRAAPGEIRNARTAFLVFEFATSAGDFQNAWAVLGGIETRLAHQALPQELEAARAYREGHRALRAGEWERSRRSFDIAFRYRSVPDRERLILLLFGSIEKLRALGREAEIMEAQGALRKLAAPE